LSTRSIKAGFADLSADVSKPWVAMWRIWAPVVVFAGSDLNSTFHHKDPNGDTLGAIGSMQDGVPAIVVKRYAPNRHEDVSGPVVFPILVHVELHSDSRASSHSFASLANSLSMH